MILYYTYKQKTKVFAQAFGQFLNLPTYQLVSDINNKSGLGFIFTALKLTFTNKAAPINNMPATLPEEIYVCSPIWGGSLAAPVKYFFQNTQLKNTKVNLILTASTPTEKYKNAATEYLQKYCIPGKVYLFATSDKVPPEEDVLVEQLREMDLL